MVDCKKAILATEDVTEAFEWLRKKGLARAAKMAHRAANEGLVAFRVNEAKTVGCLVEVNSETDFVARNDLFQSFTDSLTQSLLQDRDMVMTPDGERSPTEAAAQLSATVGERVSIGRTAFVKGDAVAGYAHNALTPHMGRTAALVGLNASSVDEALLGAAKRVAMHVVAARPAYLTSADVPKDVLDREKDVVLAQLQEESKKPKPPHILEKILLGKLSKFADDRSLATQISVVDDSKRSITDLLHDDFNASLSAFACFQVGDSSDDDSSSSE